MLTRSRQQLNAVPHQTIINNYNSLSIMENKLSPNNPIILWANEISPYYKNKDYEKVLSIDKKIWDELEEPKLSQELAFHVLLNIVVIYITLNDFESAQYWGNILDKYNYVESGRFDSGQKDYFVGIVYFERKEYQKAFEYFSNAKVKSRGRCFKMVWGEKLKNCS